MDNEIIKRLEWHDGGDGVDYEFWKDPDTGKLYKVPIQIERLFDQAEAVDRVSKFFYMNHFDKTVLETVQKDIEAVERVGSMRGLIGWWSVTDAHGTGLAGEDQWNFVTDSYPKFVEWVLKQYMENEPHPMYTDRKIHWRDIDDYEVMTAYIEEMGSIDNI